MEIGILDILGFEEFQKNGFEQVGQCFHLLTLVLQRMTFSQWMFSAIKRGIKQHHTDTVITLVGFEKSSIC